MQRDGGAGTHVDVKRHVHQPDVARDQDKRTWRPPSTGDAVACNTARTRRDNAAGAQGVGETGDMVHRRGAFRVVPARGVTGP